MRFIKLAILSFIILFLLVTVISLFIPSNIRISKATNIAADDIVIDTNIKNLSNWKNWHPSLKDVPEKEILEIDHSGIRVKGTSIRITQITEQSLLTVMTTDKGQPVVSGFNTITHPGDSSTLQWFMDFELRWYPWEKFRSLFYENIYGVQMEQGLHNLKELSKASRS